MIHQQRKEAPKIEESFEEIRENTVIVGREYLLVRPTMFSDDASSSWREFSTPQFIATFVSLGYTKKAVNDILCRLRLDLEAMYVQSKNVLPSYPLHPEGYQRIGNTPVFIQSDWKIITPEKGDPMPVIRQILRMFGTQTDILLGWLQGALMRQLNYRAQIKGAEQLPYPPLASQTLCICGGQGYGKTRVFLSCIISELLGTYTAIPASWYSGQSQFADWMLSASVYVADDSIPLASYKDRVALASRLKSLGYPERISCECKGKAAIDISFPNERICLANMKNGAIESLPDTSIDGDKFLVLHVFGPAGCMEDYGGDFMRMDRDLRMTIPAFAHWLLNEYTIPEWAIGTASRRHAVMNLGSNRGYVAPAIKRAVAEIDKAGILMAKIRRLYYNGPVRGRWLSRTALRYALENTNGFKSIQCLSEEFESLLAECHSRWPHIIEKRRVSEGIQYRLCDVPDVDAAMQTSYADDYGERWNQDLLNLTGLTQQNLEERFRICTPETQVDVDAQQNDIV